MPSLDLRPGRLDLFVRPGNAHTVILTWFEALTGRTFTAAVDATALPTPVVAGSTLTVTIPAAVTTALVSGASWTLSEGGAVLITGRVVGSTSGAVAPTQEATVTLATGAVDVVAAGAPGPGGGGAGGGSYVHTQASAASLWVISHVLGYRPAVHVENGSGVDVEADVSHPTVNETRINFNTPIAGIAYLS